MTVRHHARTAFAIAAFAGVIALPAVAGRDTVPFKGSASGQAAQSAANVSTATLTGTGEASHLGRYTIAGTLTVDYSTLQATGQTTFTAANGDTLTANITGTAVKASSSATDHAYKVSGTLTVTGGTGRFAGRTGTATFRGLSPQGGQFTITFDGALNKK